MMDAYEKLANTIILQAVKDWRAARRKLKRKPQNESARIELGNCERFFHSEWFTTLTDVDGEVILRKLYEEDGR
ncbi:hypothetical protein H8S37_03185 [Mediterraneibacter sp. NSJ-55]|uniref:Uncharacterized protein n=2 Tax=Mediterraneibacter hominis TaxID=2763054 RepID=A0A923LH62_9FIRM|nr:hypothetical protein [Mediterraneibacter hominis]